VTLTVPVLLTAALGLSASFARYSPIRGLSSVLPFLLVWPGFLFLYMFFPYTKVRWGPALLGSFVTAALWQLAQWGYVHFQVHVAGYQAVYGALAAIPILLAWIYISWVILLFGVELCAASQFGTPVRQAAQTPDFTRSAALLVMLRIGERLMNRRDMVTSESLAQELGIAESTLTPLLERLKMSGLLVQGEAANQREHGQGLFLTRDPAILSIDQILSAASGRGEPSATDDPRVVNLLERLDHKAAELLGSVTLRDLLAGDLALDGGETHPRADERRADAKP